jgi:site-specific DNA-methyltransferase (adenine-specific)
MVDHTQLQMGHIPKFQLHLGNCLDTLKTCPDNSIDSIVTDPPYGISFMSKKWDYDVPSVEIWQECLRVLKPGGYLLSFASTRTQHRMAVNIEDAGFTIKDCITWVYSSGFPKSHNVSCAIDKSFGHPNRGRAIPTASTYQASDVDKENKLTSNEVAPYEPITDEAKAWQGWGTALKPACEPITVAQKPIKGTIASNVLEWGTGAINVDATRVPMDEDDFAKLSAGVEKIRERGGVMDNSWKNSSDLSGANPANPLGRWGANFIHDGSQEVLDLFPNAKGGAWVQTEGARHFNNNGKPTSPKRLGSDSSTGSAARFFYCSKSNKRDRNEGLEDLEPKQYSHDGRETRNETAYQRNDSVAANHHPTVKPTDLMCYLVRMVTRLGGTVLDPFMGSGTTGKAAMREGMNFIGCELDAEYLAIAEKRIQYELNKQA